MAASDPRFRAAAFATWRWIKTLRLKAETTRAMRRAKADSYLDATRVLWVAPEAVKRMAALGDAYAPRQGYGHVVGGDWDLATQVNEEQRYFRVVAEVVSKGIQWRDSETGREARERIAAGGTWMGCDDMEPLEERWRYHDDLLLSMRQSGYLTQRQLRSDRPPSFHESMIDEVLVGVGRDGRILLIDGRHRFAIARLLRIEKMPVQVGVRHPAWMAFRRDVAAYARRHGGAVPQPLLHPDLDDIPAADDSRAVFEAIRRELPAGGDGMVLDIGAQWGYFSHRCEDAGLDCVALESRAEPARFLERLRVACDRRFKVVDDWSVPAPHRGGRPLIGLALERVDPANPRTGRHYVLTALKQNPVDTLFVRPPSPQGSGTLRGRGAVDESWLDRVMSETGLGRRDLVAVAAGTPVFKLTH